MTDSATSTLLVALLLVGTATCAAAVGVATRAQARRYARERAAADAERVRLEEAVWRLEQARAVAEAANRAKSHFLANMSHELRTPLHAILDYSAMAAELLEGDEDAGELTADLERIGVAGRHLLGVIDGVLDLSRTEVGRMRLVVESFDAAAAVREVAGTAAPLLARNGNTFEVSCADDLGLMRSDATKLRQVLLNLLSNAGKFTAGGRIVLTASRSPDGSWLAFEVRDSGAGMTADQVAQLFQPFAVVDPEATRRHGGTGLGLALSRRFCTLMGGDIEVRSAPGSGSSFTVRLPAAVSDFAASGVYVAAAVPGQVPASAASGLAS